MNKNKEVKELASKLVLTIKFTEDTALGLIENVSHKTELELAEDIINMGYCKQKDIVKEILQIIDGFDLEDNLYYLKKSIEEKYRVEL